ncbi:hypothetical protein ABT009_08270 [Streptomyces sp. NPDC002896]|uniref:hypothetical protein n=1 Tax=Streptomyces sp. NPDC002896 TaxID=3154438 RepID=UPI00332B69A8
MVAVPRPAWMSDHGLDQSPTLVGTLSVHYRNDQPVLTALGGTLIPRQLTVQDADGQVLATHTDQPPALQTKAALSRSRSSSSSPSSRTDTPDSPGAGRAGTQEW